MEINDAITATSVTKHFLNPVVFQPLSAKKLKKHWLIKANIGALDNIIVTVKLPTKLVSCCFRRSNG